MDMHDESQSLPFERDKAWSNLRESPEPDARNFRITLKQWKMLQAVVDCGSFTEAAEFLHISQSAISYTIAKLQEQLGLPLFRHEGRRVQLTEEGNALLERSRNLVRNAFELELFAENLRRGRSADVHLAVDPNFPTHIVTAAIRELAEAGCDINVSLNEVSLRQAEKALFDRTADLAITTRVPLGFHGSPLIALEYVPVAHPGHPLFNAGRVILAGDLERQVQIMIGGSEEERQHLKTGGTGAPARCWNVYSFDTAVEALCEGVGYAWLPRHRVERRLANGELRMLPIHQERSYKIYLYLICGPSVAPGSSASQFADLLQARAADEGGRASRANR